MAIYTKKQQEQIDMWSKVGERITNRLLEINEEMRHLGRFNTPISDEFLELTEEREKLILKLRYTSRQREEAMLARDVYEKKKKELADLKEKWGF